MKLWTIKKSSVPERILLNKFNLGEQGE